MSHLFDPINLSDCRRSDRVFKILTVHRWLACWYILFRRILHQRKSWLLPRSLTDFNQPKVSDLLIKNGINKNRITLISYSRILVTALCSGDPRVWLLWSGWARQEKADLQVSALEERKSRWSNREHGLLQALAFMDPATLINEICPLLGISSSLQFPFVLTAEPYFMMFASGPAWLCYDPIYTACVSLVV